MALWNVDYVIKNKYSRPGYPLLGVRGIIMHWTGNPGATDTNHADFFDGADGGGSRYASAHLFVDRDSATLIIPLNEVAYHANEHACRIPKLVATASYYKNGGANLTSIGVEMCVEKNGTIHAETVARTIQVVAELCKMYGLGTEDIYRHNDVTGKDCPSPWVSNPSLFTAFKQNVAAALKGTAPVSAPAPTPAPTSPVNDVHKGSLVDYLASIGQDSSFANRAKLAAQYGIAGYQGTAAQNVQLLALLRDGGKTSVAARTVIGRVEVIVDGLNIRKGPGREYDSVGKAVKGKTYDVYANINDWHMIGENEFVLGNNGQYLSLVRDRSPYAGGNASTTSVVDYLASIGQDSSFANRKRIAAELGISGYSGTAAQNELLLNKMRG